SLTSITFSDYKDLRMGNITNPFSDLLPRSDFYVERIGGQDTMLVSADKNKQRYTGYNQTDFLQKFLFQPNNKIRHVLSVHLSTSSNIPRYDRLVEKSGNLPRYAEWNYGPQLRVMGSYNLSATVSKKLMDYVQAVVAYQRIKESRINRRFGEEERKSNVEDVDVVSLNVDLSKQVKNHLVRYGLEATYNHVASTGTSFNIVTKHVQPESTRYPEGGTNTYSAAAYITNTWAFAKQWKLNGGIRFSYNGLDSKFGDSTILDLGTKKLQQSNGAVNGSLGILWNNKGWTFTLLGSTGFRSPNLDDLGKVFNPQDGVLLVPNPNLKPTYLFGGEMAIRRSFGNNGKIEVVGYYSHLIDAIVRAPYAVNGNSSVLYQGELLQLFANQNKQQAFITGVSSNLALNIYNGLAATASVTYTYGRVFTDTTLAPLDHIPPLFGKAGFQHQWKRLRTEVYFNWSAWKLLKDYSVNGADNFETATVNGMPAWYTLNFRVSYGIIPSIRVQVAVENILDQNYRAFGSSISAPGRNFLITLRANL
ncbi:TonB-dependent receptor plug domain-containing protein, partial [Bacteroidota bacterium]